MLSTGVEGSSAMAEAEVIGAYVSSSEIAIAANRRSCSTSVHDELGP
jgi:hypothetical protein